MYPTRAETSFKARAAGAVDVIEKERYVLVHQDGRRSPGNVPVGYGDRHTDSGAATPGSVLILGIYPLSIPHQGTDASKWRQSIYSIIFDKIPKWG
jgi:hypothetical protein